MWGFLLVPLVYHIHGQESFCRGLGILVHYMGSRLCGDARILIMLTTALTSLSMQSLIVAQSLPL